MVESVYGEEKSPAISKLELLLTELSRSYFVFALAFMKTRLSKIKYYVSTIGYFTALGCALSNKNMHFLSIFH